MPPASLRLPSVSLHLSPASSCLPPSPSAFLRFLRFLRLPPTPAASSRSHRLVIVNNSTQPFAPLEAALMAFPPLSLATAGRRSWPFRPFHGSCGGAHECSWPFTPLEALAATLVARHGLSIPVVTLATFTSPHRLSDGDLPWLSRPRHRCLKSLPTTTAAAVFGLSQPLPLLSHSRCHCCFMASHGPCLLHHRYLSASLS